MDDVIADAIEPVHWGARLVRADDVHYTEVGGTPLLVRHTDGEVQALTPAWAAIWAQLDGRPVAEALSIEPSSFDPIDARNLVEVLRRLKAKGVIRDASSSTEPRDASDLERAASTGKRVKVMMRGSVAYERGSTTLTIDPTASERAVVSLAEETTGVTVTFRRRLRRRRIDLVEVTDSVATVAPSEPVEYFATIIRSLDDREVLSTPGLVDLLAGLAERAEPPASLHH